MGHGTPVIQYVHRPGILDLGWGHPNPDLMPVDEWARATADALRAHSWKALTYGYDPGPGPLVEWLAERLRATDPPGCDPSEVFVTAGASHALHLVCQVLTAPGDVVLVDAPTYHLAFRAILDHRVDLVPVPTDADGPDPVALADLLDRLRSAGRRVPMLYLVPTFGNPTGRSLPDHRRRALVDLAGRAGLTLVEDDTYRELVYDGTAPGSLRSLAGHEHVVRLGSFSKTVAPGLRLGWVDAAPELVRRLVTLGYVHSGGGLNHTAALAMAEFGASGAYDAHLAKVRSHYARQRDALAGALRGDAPELSGDVPAGGWFLWRELPPGLAASALLPVAERHGVSFVPGERFFVDGGGGARHVRLSFSPLPPDGLAEAARRLAAAVADLRATTPRIDAAGR